MKLELWLVPTMALLAGAAGGVATHILVHDQHPDVIRARRIELIDGSGRVAAFLGIDSERDTALVFLDDQHKERAIFGVRVDKEPEAAMIGRDGKDRVRIKLASHDERPMIRLGDHERTRVDLGFYQLDAPDPRDENWGLTFYDPHRLDQRLAGIGMGRDYTDDKMTGYAIVSEKDGTVWRVGLK